MKKTELTKNEVMNAEINEEFSLMNEHAANDENKSQSKSYWG